MTGWHGLLRYGWSDPLVQKWGRRLVLLASFLICASLVLLSGLMNDDEMYLAASALLPNEELYKDFAYLQTPYMPYVYSLVFEVFGFSYLVLLSRLTELAFIAGILALVYRIALSLSGNAWYATFAVFFLANVSVFQETIKSARNNNLAILLCLTAFLCIERLRTKGSGFTAYAGAGVCIGAAIGVKLTYAVMVPFLLALPWTDYRWSRRSIPPMIYAVLGIATGLMPAVLLCVSAGADVSSFNNITYHQLNAQWRQDNGYERAMTLLGKLQNIRQEFKSTSMGLLLLLSSFVAATAFRRKAAVSVVADPKVQRCGLLVSATIPMFIVPTPVWAHYFPMFVLALLFLSGALLSRLGHTQRHFTSLLLISVATVLVLLNTARDGKNFIALASMDNWTGVRIHREAKTIAARVEPAERMKPVATLAPIYALEAGLPIYDELSTGSFAYRIGDYLSPEERRKARVTSRSDVYRLLAATPPSAILLGAAPKLEKPFELFAKTHGYSVIRSINDKLKLYTKQ